MEAAGRSSEDWPDKEFLEVVLKHRLCDTNAKIEDFKSERATKKGDNYTSDMFRVTVKCEQLELPMIIIFKRLIKAESISQTSSYTREKLVLGVILPQMYSGLKNVMPGAEPFGPDLIYATPGVLVMEDLQKDGFRMAERKQGLDLKHCSLVMRTLAAYHAVSVLLLEKTSKDFNLLQKSIFGENNVTLENFCNGMVKTLSEEVKNFEGLKQYGPKLASFAEKNFNTRLQRVVEDCEKGDFRVISHGDLWVNNILFRYSDSEELNGIRLVDYQMSCITSPCIDLQCFLTTSCNEDVRTNSLTQLLEEYHVTLCEIMATLKCSRSPPTFEYLLQEYDRKTVYGMFAAISGLPVVLSEPGQFELGDITGGGHPQSALFKSAPYKRALEWYLPIFESKGYL